MRTLSLVFSFSVFPDASLHPLSRLTLSMHKYVPLEREGRRTLLYGKTVRRWKQNQGVVSGKPERPSIMSVCYHEYLHKAIAELKKELAAKDGDPKHDAKKNLQNEKELLDWLDDMSIERLFAWFDCIEETRVNMNMSKRWWRTKTI